MIQKRNQGKLFALVISVMIILNSGCIDPVDGSVIEDPHEFITVILGGEFAEQNGESADVYINNEFIGTAGAHSEVVKKNALPGNYTIRVETKNIPATIFGNVSKQEFKAIRFVAPCDASSVSFNSSLEYLLEGVEIFVHVDGLVLALPPGLPVTLPKVTPEVNKVFNFRDLTGKLRHTVTKTIPYSSSWSYDVPYQK
ncbi:MAG: hypothetical protein IPM92_13645 [Saprospiraceae bacterium]|nr:hypothetical protein [Saprospiraceae bacterium]